MRRNTIVTPNKVFIVKNLFINLFIILVLNLDMYFDISILQNQDWSFP